MRDTRPLLRAALVGLLLLVSAPQSWAATRFVAADGTGDYATIEAAIVASEADDEIVLGDGTFRGDGNRDLYLPPHAITIRSESGDPSRTIVDAEGTDADPHFFLFLTFLGERAALAVEGLSITGTYEQSSMVVGVAPFTLSRCWVYGNTSTTGGAVIECWNAGVVEETIIVGNVVLGSGGGALVVVDPIAFEIRASTIAHNVGGELTMYLPFGASVGGVHIDRSVVWDECDTRAIRVAGVHLTVSRSLLDPEHVSTGFDGSVTYLDDPIVSNPLFCDPVGCDGAPAGPADYSVATTSPCLPGHNPWGVLLGALGLGCEATPTRSVSWSDLKEHHLAPEPPRSRAGE
jgi:hypothetical protein